MRTWPPTPDEWRHREFPVDASIWDDEVSRREFLRLMAASFALAGLTGCIKMPEEKIVPYARQPEEIVPGKPLYFATAMMLGGYATGLLVESHEGRPTKIEGNPLHPASLGATDVFSQASILTLYDPHRSQVVSRAGEISTWSEFSAALGAELATQGTGLRILTETVSSPTLAWQIAAVLGKFPRARWHQYEPLARDNALEGARLAFGEAVETRYRFEKADVILALDADFLSSGPGWVRYAREFADRRRMRDGTKRMNRLYVVEPSPTTTGAMADHRFVRRASEIEHFLRNLPDPIARDLRRGRSLVVVGDSQPPIVHALAHALNHQLGNVGETLFYTDPVAAHPVSRVDSLRELVSDMQAGTVDVLVIIGGNPVQNAPADFGFAAAMSKVKFRAHLGLYDDETYRLCHWHIPEAHYLETWSDGRAFDGTVTIQQPLIAPLYAGKSAHEILAVLLGRADRKGHDMVREYWKAHGLADDNLWHAALHDGVVPGTALEPKAVSLRPVREGEPNAASGLELLFRPDPTIWDGRFANNGWLQELPKPLTRLTWSNAALVSPATAQKLGVANEDVVELELSGRTVRVPIWIVPGQAEETVVVAVADAHDLRPSDAFWLAQGAMLRKTGERSTLACTQHHQSMEGRDLVRVGTLPEFLNNPTFAHNEIDQPSLYPGYKYDDYAWGMSIDLTACVGCSACVVACQSENNIPIVGPEQVARGREMHWIRVDRYFTGELSAPDIVFEPVPCMHCENAPCELVCPVNATNHTAEGLNAQVYNRCIGTRYCSNNCPYKVRRFNFLQYSDLKTPTLKMRNNPNVTVRNRGVMEKCTYCVQRIQAVKIVSETEDRPIRDGEIIPACAQACPTQAIVFGNINDPNSRVAQLKKQPHNYGLLVELNTRPRTTYLARIRNPNPEVSA